MTSTHYYLVVISFIFGIFGATIFSIPQATLVWLMGGALIFAILWRRFNHVNNKIYYLEAGLILAFFVLGAVRLNITLDSFGQSELAKFIGQEIVVSGVVVCEPEVREKVKYLYVQAEDDLLLVSTDRYTKVAYGDVVTVFGQLTKPEEFITDFSRTFDYPGYLLAKGVEYRMTLASIVVEGKDAGNFFIAQLLNFKSVFLENISTVIPEPASGLGSGLLLGVKQALGEKLELAFRETGIIHIVVLSGYNVMLVVIFIMYILGYFLPLWPRIIVGILAIIVFALLVGLSATVVRACLMASLVLVVQVFGRTYIVLRGLMLAGVIMLLLNPLLLIYDVGFQLSFLATLGLILLSPRVEQWFKIVPGKLGVRSFLVATISTQIAVLPLLLYQIGQFSVVAVVVNVLVLPMVPVAMILTFITGLAVFMSPFLASLIAVPTFFSLSYINQLALWFAELPFASFVVPAFPFYFVPIAYAIMGYLLYRSYQPNCAGGYSEMAESIIKSTLAKEKKFDLELKDWIIEEEPEKLTRVKDSDKSCSDLPESDTPIFFR